MATFSERFRELRAEKSLTLEELAKVLGTTKTTLSRYENKKRVPDSDFITKAADFFCVTTDYLLGRSDIRNPYKNEGTTTIAAHRNNGYDEPLTDEELFAIEQFREFLKQQRKKEKNKDE